MVYFDTQETMDDDVEEFHKTIKDAQELLTQKTKTPTVYDTKSELQRIQNENDEEKKSMMMKIKSKSSDGTKLKKLPSLEQNLWGRTSRLDEDNMWTTQWLFIDENHQEHSIILKHQQIKQNKKSKRSMHIDG